MPAKAAKPRAMFGPLCGGPEDIPGRPASGPSRPGSRRWRWRRCSLPAAAAPPRTSERTERARTRSRSPKPSSRPSSGSARPRCCSSASATPATGPCPASPSASRSRANGAKTPRCRSGSATRSRNSPSPIARSGFWRRPTRIWTAPPSPAAPRPRARKTFAFGPLKPGETATAVWKLSAVRAGKYTLLYAVGAGLGGGGEGGDRRRRRPGGSFVDRDHANDCRKPKSPTAAKSLKSRRASRASTAAAAVAVAADAGLAGLRLGQRPGPASKRDAAHDRGAASG